MADLIRSSKSVCQLNQSSVLRDIITSDVSKYLPECVTTFYLSGFSKKYLLVKPRQKLPKNQSFPPAAHKSKKKPKNDFDKEGADRTSLKHKHTNGCLTYFTKTNIVVFLLHYLLHWFLFLKGNKAESTPLIGLVVHGELYGFNLVSKKVFIP